MRVVAAIVWALAGAACAAEARAQGTPGELDALARVRDARSHRVSSTDPDPASNRDNAWVEPGATRVLADLVGPGVVRHIWLTFAEAGPSWLAKDGAANPSEIALRMYWDGQAEPAVEAPLGDFFAAGFGTRAEVRSTPIQVEGGDAYNCFFPMPFRKSARIELTNESEKPLAALYWQIDWTAEPLQADAAYFCAQYRQEFPAEAGKPYLVLDATGRGHYVGTVLSVRTRSPEWFGEGDDRFVIDGEAQPSLVGTGTEDYFLNAWGLARTSFPTFGVPLLSGAWGEVGVRLTAYRWHLADPVHFARSLRVELEHAGWMAADETASGKVEGFVERADDFATVAFWYQVEPPRRFTRLPPARERALPQIDVVYGGAALLAASALARGPEGALSLQAGSPFSGSGQLFFSGTGPGDAFECAFQVERAERRRFVVALTHSYDFGVYRLALDGEPLGPPIDCYSAEVEVIEHAFGDHTLSPGRHVLAFECAAQNSAATGCRLGVDAIRLRERSGAKRAPPAWK